MSRVNEDVHFMAQALDLAVRGRGFVEPNPMVGCVLVKQGQVVGEGWHQRFGGPHAEVEAISQAGNLAQGATAYVTLEPCCHTGKTPPCTSALLQAGVSKVVVGCRDRNPQVAGGGIRQLRQDGIEVAEGVLEEDCKHLVAPFTKLMLQGKPWVIAKWAMTLDGKIATSTGSSQWVSGEQSRTIVHQLRGTVDALLVGRRTVEMDDPLLTARPPGHRVPLRIVLDSHASIPIQCQLLKTIDKAPLLVAVSEDAQEERCQELKGRGAEVLRLSGRNSQERLMDLLTQLGKRQVTNLLVEGGTEVLGSFFDLGQIDEVHAFLAPKLVGGKNALSPIHGQGTDEMCDALQLQRVSTKAAGQDIHVHGFIH